MSLYTSSVQFSSYLAQNTARLHYKAQQVNPVWCSNCQATLCQHTMHCAAAYTQLLMAFTQ